MEVVAWPAGYDSAKRPATSPRCEAMGETIDPSCQEAHVQNFLDCVKSRQRPVADVEIGYRSVSACHAGVIVYKLGRKVEWDASLGTFRAPWTLPAV